jgi:hypothetical protein
MPKLFGFAHLRLRRPGRLVVGQEAAFELPPAPVKRRLYAFTVSSAGTARCLDFADDEDGLAALARHCRGDRVVKIVHGTDVELDRSDVVHLKVDNERKLDSLPLM